jgi:hypothetical protein
MFRVKVNQAGKNSREERVVSKATSKPTGTHAMQRARGQAVAHLQVEPEGGGEV